MPDALAGFGLPVLSEGQSYATVGVAGVVVFFGALMAKRKANVRQSVDLTTSESLRLATRAVEDAHAKQVLERDNKTSISREETPSKADGPTPSHFGQAPMRRDSKVVPDIEEVRAPIGNVSAAEKLRTEPRQFDLEEDLYLEPYDNLESCRVAYYQVCLSRKAAIDKT
ncbi:MAG: hypothetical protein AAFR27_13805, partial [Pseudomonadota bacterium]